MAQERLKQKETPMIRKSKYLRQRSDGYVYPWTPHLAERVGEFDPVDELPDEFKKEQQYNDNVEPADIRFMRKEEILEEARIKYGVKLKDKKSADMKIDLRALRKGSIPEDATALADKFRGLPTDEDE